MGGFFFYAQNHYLVSAQKSEEKILKMTLSAFVPEVIPPVEVIEEPIVEEALVVEPEIIKEPLPKEETKIKEEIVPEPIVEKIIPKPEVKKKTRQKKVRKNQVNKKVSARKSKSSKAEKNKFLANIRAKINKHKSYPKVAKRRGMQGSVKVKFTILRSGKVGNISINGPKVFHNSARTAVKSAFPVNATKSPLKLPQSINLTLRYQLR